MACSVDGCDRRYRARGFCNLHYLRWRRHGDPLTVRTRPKCVFCDQPHRARGFCWSHYARWRRAGKKDPHLESGTWRWPIGHPREFKILDDWPDK